MAVAHDASSNVAAWSSAGNPASWTHTPVGTPRGVVVMVDAQNDSTDRSVTCTYGGVSCTQVSGSPINMLLGGEINQMFYVFFLGSSIPTGAQTITVNSTGGVAASDRAAAFTVTAATDTDIEDTSTVDSSGANPTVTLTINETSQVYGMCASGHDAVGSIAAGGSYTEYLEHDFGANVTSWIRRTAVTSSDATVDWTALTEEWAIFAVAVKEVTVTHTESFDKADSTTLGPDQTWTETASDMEVVGNAARNVTAGTGARARCELNLGSNDHLVSMALGTWAVSATTAAVGVCARFDASADTCYAFVAGWFLAPYIQLTKIVTGTSTVLAQQIGVTVAVNDSLVIQCDGSIITSYINNVQALQVVDTSITTGTRGGIVVSRSTTEDIRVAHVDMLAGVYVYGSPPRLRTTVTPNAAVQQASNW